MLSHLATLVAQVDLHEPQPKVEEGGLPDYLEVEVGPPYPQEEEEVEVGLPYPQEEEEEVVGPPYPPKEEVEAEV